MFDDRSFTVKFGDVFLFLLAASVVAMAVIVFTDKRPAAKPFPADDFTCKCGRGCRCSMPLFPRPGDTGKSIQDTKPKGQTDGRPAFKGIQSSLQNARTVAGSVRVEGDHQPQ